MDGSGTGKSFEGISLAGQYFAWREHALKRTPETLFIAYLQSFSNTYGSAEDLRQLLQELSTLPDMAGVAIGTRPDCLNDEKLEILTSAPFQEVWLDLGLQSANDRTLRILNRGHDAACFAEWSSRAGKLGIKVCAHVITGLPGEDLADFKQTITFVNNLPVAGIKIHNLFVARGTTLERHWQDGRLTLLSREDSLKWLIRGLCLLRPDIVIHRMNADPAGDELLAPEWAREKRAFLDAARKQMENENLWQGQAQGYGPSPWFNFEGGEAT